MTDENDSPIFTSDAAVSVAENQTVAYTALATDADGDDLSYNLSGTDAARFMIDATTGEVRFIEAPDFEAPGDVDGDNVYDIVVTASDGTNSTDQTVAITVTNENDNAPSFTSDAAVSVAENQTAAYAALAMDVDGDDLSYNLSGTDAARFMIDAATGEVRFIEAPDFENPGDADGDNVYDIVVTASDGTNSTDQAVAITVTDETDITAFQRLLDNPRGASVADFEAAGIERVNVLTLDATRELLQAVGENDPETLASLTPQQVQAITDIARDHIVSISGPEDAGIYDSGEFTLGSNPAIVSVEAGSFIVALDYDGDGETDHIANIEFDADYQVQRVERDFGADNAPDDPPDVVEVVERPDDRTVQITYDIQGDGDTDRIETYTLDESGDRIQIDVDTDADGNTDRVESYEVDADGNRIQTDFDDDADGATDRIEISTYDESGNRVQTDFDDDADGTIDRTEDIADAAPVFTSPATANVAENRTEAYTAIATDADSDALTYSLSGTDAALFTIDPDTGVVSFITPPDFETPGDDGRNNVYDITVTATDGSNEVDRDVAITVTDVDDGTNVAPVFTSPTSADVAETQTLAYMSVATDADGDTLMYSLSGTDAALFTIDPATGAVSFIAPPDFETQGDLGGDNVYDIVVTASDGTSSTDQSVAITVTNVNDNTPSFTSPDSASVAENETLAYMAVATDADGDDLSYSLSGTDAALFTIDGTTGAVRFTASPDFENPGDAGGDNVYDITVTATDGSNGVDRDVAITVTDVDDGTNVAPIFTSPTSADVAETQTLAYMSVATDADGDTLMYSLSGTDAARFMIDPTTGAVRFIASPDFENPGDAGGNNVYDITVTASDGDNSTNHDVAITVTNVNDNTPSFSSPDSASVEENQTMAYTAMATDADGDDLSYSLFGTDATLFTIDPATGVVRFRAAPDFENPGDIGGDNVYDIIVTASDNTGGTTDTDQAVAITVTDANDVPVFSSPATASAAENQSAATVVYRAVATDADGDALSYSLSGTDAALFTIDANTGDVRFREAPDAENPGDDDNDNVYDIIVTASDNIGGTADTDQAVAITVTNVNDNAPVFSSPATASAAENQTAAYTTQATDADGDTLSYSLSGTDAALFTIDANTGEVRFNEAPDFEAPGSADGDNVYDIIVTASDNTGGTTDTDQAVAITVTNANDNAPVFSSPATATVAENQRSAYRAVATDVDGDPLSYSLSGADAALFTIDANTGDVSFREAPDFENPGSADGDNVYDIIVTASDGAAANDIDQAVVITVTGVNDNAPVFNSPATASVAENQSAATVVYTAVATDADGDALSYSLSGTDAALFTIDADTGEVRFNEAPDFEAPGSADGDNVYDIIVTASDNTAGTTDTNQAVAITVTNVNDNAPVISSPATVSVAENQTAAYTTQATDADGDTLSYSLSGGADAALFTINETTGEVSFATPPDFETPGDTGGDNVYDIIITVTDGANETEQAVAITVTDENDPPVFTSPATAAVAENQTDAYTAQATDADGDSPSYRLSGTDAALFTIDATTGEVSFNTPPDFEAPGSADGDNVYEIMVTASDGVNETEQAVAITVTNENDNTPVFNSPASAEVAENQSAATVVYTAAATDADGDTLSYSLSGTDTGLFTINPTTGAVSFVAPPDFEMPGDDDGDNVYDIIVTASDNTAGTTDTDQAVAITVTDVNDNVPVFSSPATASVAENQSAATVVYRAVATDADGDALSYSLSGTDAALFTIDANTGEVRFNEAPDFEAPGSADGDNVYDIIVTASDNTGGTPDTDQAVAITVTGVNDNAPVFSSPATASVAENQSAATVVYRAVATDADGDALSYSLSGTDAALFTIDANTGEVRFNEAPDFEEPGSADSDNVYEIIVTASDNTAGTTDTNQMVAITVTNANDNAPVFSSPATASVAENPSAATVVYRTVATDGDGDALSYSLSGTDAARFTIDANTGDVRFREAPDAENPGDDDNDNVYDIIVTASDNTGGTTDTNQAVAITVTGVNDNAPVFSSPATASVAENQSAATVVYRAVATDADGDTLSYSLSGTDAARFTIDANTGDVRFREAPDAENPGDDDNDNVYDIIVTASDNTGGTTDRDQAVAITVTNVNDNTPVFSSPATASVAENQRSAYTAVATDADGDPLTYSLSGTDAALFTIDPATGVVRVSFRTPPDFEMPGSADGDNVYDITVTASDGDNSADQAVAITVTDEDEVGSAPAFTSLDSADVAENETMAYTAVAEDADAGDTVSYRLSGGADIALFTIDETTGVVSFIDAPDFENPDDAGGDNVYNITVTASDSINDTPQAVAITVTNVNDNDPVFNSPATASVAEKQSAATVVYTAVATDADGDPLTYSLSGTDAALFTIDANTGEVRFNEAPDFEAPGSADGDNVYDITVTASDNTGGTTDTNQAVAITVTGVNDNAPVFSSPATASVAESPSAATVVYRAVATDADGDALSYSLSGTDVALFTIDANTGDVRFREAPDFEAPGSADSDNVYEIIVTASDNTGGTPDTNQAVAITVTNANDNAPVFSSPATAGVAENQSAATVVYRAVATDADGDALSYSLSGTDAARFTIDANTGDVRFREAPDAENPGDDDDDNVYDIIVTASDNTAGTTDTDQAVAITVTNANDNAPVFSSPATASVAESPSAATVVYRAVATDADGDALTYSLSGTDAARFTIDANTGEVRFREAPNAENPGDDDNDNVYDIIVTASDNTGGTADTDQAVAITVTGVNDNTPVFSSPATASVAENQRSAYTAVATDADGDPLTYSLSGTDAALFTIDPATGVVSFRTSPDFEMPGSADGDNVYDITVTASDGDNSADQAVAITVTDEDEVGSAPAFTSPDSASVEENQTMAYTAMATGTDGDPLTYSLSGTDAALFTIDATTGVVSFITAPDFENPGDAGGDNVYDITVTASDGANETDQAVAITVTDEYEPFELSTLDGVNGFVLNGIDADDRSGFSVSSAGDVNGDGYDDLIIGANRADPNGAIYAGETYVVYGGASAPGTGGRFNLSTLDGTNGFILSGVDRFDTSGRSVSSAGDVNGDGYDDLIIGAHRAGPNRNGEAGETYIVYGGASAPGTGGVLDLSDLDGTNGFILNGIDADDISGWSVSSAGDVNGDGYDDLIIGASEADPNGDGSAGETYVVYGGASAPGTGGVLDLSDLDGTNGFILNGIDVADRSGFSVSSAGDVNGDGYDDLIIGAHGADPNGNILAGETYVVYGGASAPGTGGVLDLSDLDGTNGFILSGIDGGDQSGRSVSSAGDVNGDGYDDLIIGAYLADPGGDNQVGETYVVYGGASAPGTGGVLDLSDLDGTNGFTLTGIDAFDRSGRSVSSAGDVNGDGYDDLVIGAVLGDPNGSLSGETYVVYGGASAPGTGGRFNLSTLDGTDGFILSGIDASDRSGRSVSSAGDVNGDGYDDLIIGAYRADPNGNNAAGESYVIYGGATGTESLTPVTAQGTAAADNFTGNAGADSFTAIATNDVVRGGAGDDRISVTALDFAAIDGGTGQDTLVLAGAGLSLDLTGAGHAGFDSVEVFDLSGTGANTLVLDAQAVFDLTEERAGGIATLDVLGDANDTVELAGGHFTANGTATEDGTTYNVYQDGNAEVRVQTGVQVQNPAAPVFTSDASASVAENQTGAYEAQATDEDSDTLSYSLSGTDAALFTINPTTGVVSFITAPNFENPGDAGGDNVYDITVTASDGTNSTDQTVAITVTNVYDLEPLSTLDGTNGFILNGIDAFDSSGWSVSSAGDVNGDGYDDLIIGARSADPNGDSNAGETYLVYGGASAPGTGGGFNLSTLDGTDGFILNGIDADDESGFSVSSAGDVNGDGYDDLIIGARNADPNGDSNAGETYIVYGGASAPGTNGVLDLSDLDGTNGFILNGIDADDQSGRRVSSAGDVNGDGYDDLIIGAPEADPNGDRDAGETYIVYGGASAPGTNGVLDLSDLDGTNGFILNGIDGGDESGVFVSSAGDVNGDGYDDLIIGAYRADPNGDSRAGETYVVYGGASAPGTGGVLDLSDLDGTNGFILNGIDGYDYSGFSVSSAGDVNGDGYDDLIIGARYADPNGDRSGETYVVYGGASAPGTGGVLDLSDLDGTNGFILNGIDAVDLSGWSVSSAGDVNGDGYDDLIIGAPEADPNEDNSAGETYIVYGGASAPGTNGVLDLSDLDGTNGFILNGIDRFDESGRSVSSAGDVNGDGYDDLIIGAWDADPNGGRSGETYVIYGGATGTESLTPVTAQGTAAADNFTGNAGADSFTAIATNDVVRGGAGDDRISVTALDFAAIDGGMGQDTLVLDGAGLSLNLTRAGHAGVDSVEVFDLSGTGANSLVLDALAVFDLTEERSGGIATLDVLGDGDDTVRLAQSADQLFALTGQETEDGVTYSVYRDGNAEVRVQTGVQVQIAAAPVFTSDASASVAENQTVAYEAQATDEDSDTLSYSLSGTDAALFTIDPATDVVSFITAPDFEDPDDANGDNVYDIIVTATDGANDTTQPVAITVTNVYDLEPLSRLDGTDGFILNGIDAYDESGFSVSSAGDVNGDGYDDLIIGAPSADPNGRNSRSGETYLVYGGASAPGTGGRLNLSTLDGTDGFILNGIGGRDDSGMSVSSAGDVNGDGYDDLIIGADRAGRANPSGFSSGQTYVVYGGASAPGTGGVLDLSDLDGINGFILNGIDARDYSGYSVSSAGDVNGDGYDDLIIGALSADPNGDRSGETYVVYGGASAPGTGGVLDLSDLDGTNGFILNGIDAGDQSGRSVSSAGDVNGDGYDDLIIGANEADPNEDDSAGETYIVYGGASAPGTGGRLNLSTLDGTDGFILNGIDADDRSGWSVSSAGDVNGDGYDDLIIGANEADPNGDRSGETYVVYGGASAPGTGGRLNLSTLDGTDGFILNGIDAADESGRSVSSAGDVNGDGYDDLIIGASQADPNGEGSGETYVVYGGASAPGTGGRLNLSTLDGTDGFILNGINANDRSGESVSSAGDVNGDGYDDLIIGAYGAAQGVRGSEGETYVIYGGAMGTESLTPVTAQGTAAADNFTGNAGADSFTAIATNDVVRGGAGDDRISVTALDFAAIDGGTGQDTLVLDGAGLSLDLTGAGHAGVDSVEVLDLSGTGANTLVLDALAVFDLTEERDGGIASLDVLGDADDRVEFRNSFTSSGTATEGDTTYTVYRAGNAEVRVQTGVQVQIPIAPVFTSDATASVAENQTVAYEAQATDADSDTLSYSLSGPDAALFVIDPATGVVSFITAPDFENPGDAGGDNVYVITVTASDGTNSTDQTVAITVTNVYDLEPLSTLDGTNGFILNGIDVADRSGFSVSSAGDVNGDGYDDLIIGAYVADPNGDGNAGETYVIYGGASAPGTGGRLNLSTLDGTDGFILNGIDADDRSGWSVSSAGDVNGDGYDDLIIGAVGADPNGESSGETYVVYGGASAPGTDGVLDLGALDGSGGFILNGIDVVDISGNSVSSAGDVNGDGYDDLIIGARNADPNGDSNAGETYIVYGGASAPGTNGVLDLSDLDGTNGFIFNGIDAGDNSGRSVSSAGDVNGDGYDDLIIGARYADPNGDSRAGETYVVYGGASAPGTGGVLDLSDLDGTNGFILNGIDAVDLSGWSVSSAGDVNGDGYDDLIIGAIGADPNGDNVAGETYLVYGGASAPGTNGALDLSDLDGTNGFILNGIDAVDRSGWSVSSAGDVNGDGYDDLIIGAYEADPGGDGDAGETYLVYGGASAPGTGGVLDLSDLDGTNGFILSGIDGGDQSGRSVSSAGDVNGDGYDDLIIGARRANPNGNREAGESYVIYGGATGTESLTPVTAQGTAEADNFTGNAGADSFTAIATNDVVRGAAGDDRISVTALDFAAIDGGTGQDTLVLDGAGLSLDLTGAGHAGVDSVEVFDLSGTGANTLVLDAQAVFDLTEERAGGIATLDVLGGADDRVEFRNSFTSSGTATEGDTTYTVYRAGNAEVRVQTGVQVQIPAATAPVFTSGATADAAENQRLAYTAVATDADGDALSYSLSGTDAALFRIGPNTGVVNFRQTPDFEMPGDDGGNNVYDITVTASDGSNAVDQAVAITVTDVYEPVPLSTLDGTNGFILNGIDADDESGISVSSAGDVNGDGYDDLIIGARDADPNGSYSGETYVIYGGASAPGTDGVLDLSDLDGTNGFILNGIDASDFSGNSVSSAGDVNGDGYDDLIIGALSADPNGDRSGETYIVYGGANAPGTNGVLDLSDLDGTIGFILNGIDAGDGSGISVSSARDVNGDGYDDLIIGARDADPNGSYSGETYVVYGGASAPGTGGVLDLSALNGTNGFVLNGIDARDYSGWSVSSAGDVNGDGYDDLIIGARFATPNEDSQAGETYVIYGGASAPGTGGMLDLSALDGSNGFILNGIDERDCSGASVSSAGDVNGDGYDDLIIGAVGADPNGESSGETYVVYGGASAPGTDGVLELSALDGSNGFILNGIDAGDISGNSVSSAGDVNGDGYDDLIIGATGADPNGDNAAGETYVVYGGANAPGTGGVLDLSDLDGTNGIILNGIDASDNSGISVSSAGDVNGDGYDDLIIGASRANPNGDRSGETYVIYGGAMGTESLTPVTAQGTAAADNFTGNAGADSFTAIATDDVVRGGAGDDRISVTALDFAAIDGGTGQDTLVLDGAGLSLDLTGAGHAGVDSVEVFDLSGTGANTLVLDAQAVFDLTEERAGGMATLDVVGDANDTVDLSGGNFALSGRATEDGTTYNVFNDGNVELRIQNGVLVTLGTMSSGLLSEEPVFEDLSVRDSIPDMQDTGEDAVVLMPLPVPALAPMAAPVFAGDKPLQNDLAMILRDMEVFADPVNNGDTDMDGF